MVNETMILLYFQEHFSVGIVLLQFTKLEVNFNNLRVTSKVKVSGNVTMIGISPPTISKS